MTQIESALLNKTTEIKKCTKVLKKTCEKK